MVVYLIVLSYEILSEITRSEREILTSYYYYVLTVLRKKKKWFPPGENSSKNALNVTLSCVRLQNRV
jgi:hypothetical protein